ncbi:MAG TPA: ABC transporter substrate-binding protein, partial [Longimicrobiaceae bacterium]|nr:ABC transporter substrate-binding protein [Longimicrobiaceae bacterium]
MQPAAMGGPRTASNPGRLARFRRLLPLAVLAAGACSGLPGLSGGHAPVVFGLPVPLTGTDGQPDVYGELSRNGAELARREINAKGGADGHPIEFLLRNDRGDDSTAITVAHALAADPRVVAVIGHVYSGPTIKAAGEYEGGGVAAVATSATSPEISGLG